MTKINLNDGTTWPSIRCSIIIDLHKSWKGMHIPNDRAYVTVFRKADRIAREKNLLSYMLSKDAAFQFESNPTLCLRVRHAYFQ